MVFVLSLLTHMAFALFCSVCKQKEKEKEAKRKKESQRKNKQRKERRRKERDASSSSQAPQSQAPQSQADKLEQQLREQVIQVHVVYVVHVVHVELMHADEARAGVEHGQQEQHGQRGLVLPPSHKFHDQKSGLTDIYLCFAMPILICDGADTCRKLWPSSGICVPRCSATSSTTATARSALSSWYVPRSVSMMYV
jgi:uncharacterized Zn finger protein (UPF0148 family)